MLVYANYLCFLGPGAEVAVFKAVGAWLKEQIGYGLHPGQLRQDGEFEGQRGEGRAWLRIYATSEDDPELYSWALKCGDDTVPGRQWITEVGIKQSLGQLEFTCVVRTEDASALIANPVMAAQPRIVRYAMGNVERDPSVQLAPSISGVAVRSVGHDRDTYRGLLAEIERRERDCPIVLVSPNRDGEYLLNSTELQQRLLGLAQVVQVSREFNSYEMAEVLGQARSAWGGAINVINIPTQTGLVRGRYFLANTILGWGERHERIAQVLAWVTNNTNLLRVRNHIRPEGVMQLALRRRLQVAQQRRGELDASQLRDEMDEASKLVAEQAEWITTLERGNTELEAEVRDLKAKLDDDRELIKIKGFTIQSLKGQLESAGGGQTTAIDGDGLVFLASRADQPTPFECIETIEEVYGDRCVVLASAKESARDMHRFDNGRRLLDRLRRLVTEYRSKLLDGGDNEARKVFSTKEYAAKESETVMGNAAMRRERTFTYEGEEVGMFRHIKIGVEDNVEKTIRVHFHWDAEREKIVIGYCGEHLTVPGH